MSKYDHVMNRRGILLCSSALLTALGAGCLGSNQTAETSESATDAVREYFAALEDGDRQRANQYAHPEGDYYIEADDHPFLTTQNLSITETETVDMETAVRSKFADPDEEQIKGVVEKETAAIENLQETHDFTGYQYVRHDATSDGLTFNSVYLLFEDDNWLIWLIPTFHLGR